MVLHLQELYINLFEEFWWNLVSKFKTTRSAPGDSHLVRLQNMKKESNLGKYGTQRCPSGIVDVNAIVCWLVAVILYYSNDPGCHWCGRSEKRKLCRDVLLGHGIVDANAIVCWLVAVIP